MVLLGDGAPSGGGGGGGIAIRTGDGVVVLSPVSGIRNGSHNVDRCSAGALDALPSIRIWGAACNAGVAAAAACSSPRAWGNHTVPLFGDVSLRLLGGRCEPRIDGRIGGSVSHRPGGGGSSSSETDTK